MATTYLCSYCGSRQTYRGEGPRVCSHCGATRKENDGTPHGAAARRRPWLWILPLIALVAGGVALYSFLRPGQKPGAVAPSRGASRIVTVRNPQVRELPAGSELSALDLLRSAPRFASRMFDTSLLTIATPRPMKDTEGSLYYVGEVVNRSPDRTAVSPSVRMNVVKGGRVRESSDLDLCDLPPGAHSPIFFRWSGDPRDIDRLQFVWKPVQGYAAAEAHHPRLEATITSRKMTPGTVTVNFSYTYHYVSAEVQGTVTNRGDTTAHGIQLYLTLRDPKGRITGFREKDLDPIGPGEQVQYDISADQWDDAVASMDVQALALSEAKL